MPEYKEEVEEMENPIPTSNGKRKKKSTMAKNFAPITTPKA